MDSKELNLLVYNEIISDFVSLMAEYGVGKVINTLRKEFPSYGDQVYQHLGKPAAKVAALLKA